MSEADVVEYHWSETNGKKYRRGSRQFKKADVGIEPTPAAKTPDVPWKWEEDGMTVIRGTARSAPGCHNVCGILSYVKDGKLVKVEGDPRTRTTRAACAPGACASRTTSTTRTGCSTR